MVKFVLISALFFLAACQNGKVQKDVSESGKTGAFAKFEIHEEFHNFGSLQDGEIASYSFGFKNTGEAPLQIAGTDTDCGCIQVLIPEKETMPGDSDFLEVIYNSAGDAGRVVKTVTIFANVEKKKIQLHIAANVKNKWIDINN